MIPFLGRPPERPEWHNEQQYNPIAASLFRNVFEQLADEKHRPQPSEMEEARKRLSEVRIKSWELSDHQHFALASLECQLVLGGAEGETIHAALRRARVEAWRLHDPIATAECDFFEGWLRQGQMVYQEAASCFENAVEKLNGLREDERHACDADVDFKVRALSGLAVHRFLLAQYDEAESRVAQGLELSRFVSTTPGSRATLLWVRALLQRWRGNLEDALTYAFDSVDLLERDSGNAMLGRIQGIAGEIALDLADRFCAEQPAYGRTVWMAIGHSRIQEAERIAEATEDKPGKGLAKLGHVRSQRMSHTQEERNNSAARLDTINEAEKLAPNDVTLACQAETARGHEYDAQGKHDVALTYYRNAMQIVRMREKPSDGEESSAVQVIADVPAPAMLVWPQRELLRSQEMSRG